MKPQDKVKQNQYSCVELHLIWDEQAQHDIDPKAENDYFSFLELFQIPKQELYRVTLFDEVFSLTDKEK